MPSTTTTNTTGNARQTIKTFVRGAFIVTGLFLTLGAAGAVAAKVSLNDQQDPPLRIRFVRQSPLPPTAAAVSTSNAGELLHDDAAAAAAASDKPLVMAAPLVPTSTSLSKTPRVILMEVTAYCPCTKCCGPKARGLTASGKPVSYNGGRFVAADSKMKFGTKLVIPGYSGGSPVEVLDRGSAIKGNKLDVFFASHDEARKWGRRTIAVTLLD
jgi:3D (Asp-Asp-Asp) domain-containing protein